MKSRIDRLLRARGQQERHVKLGVGGIRDVEFHVQALQLLYGAQDPWLREPNSLRALHRLAERGYLSWEESGRLAHAYVFLRTIEHRLQILHALQTHTLPADPASSRSSPAGSGTRATPRPPPPAAPRLRPDASDGARRLRGFDATVREVPGGAAVGRGALGRRLRRSGARAAEPPPPLGGAGLVAVPAAVRTRSARSSRRRSTPLRAVPDPDAALDALERFVAAAGPRTAYLARLAATRISSAGCSPSSRDRSGSRRR